MIDSEIASILVILQLLRSLFILHVNRQQSAMAVDDDEHDDNEIICRNISRLTFKFITRIVQQVNFGD